MKKPDNDQQEGMLTDRMDVGTRGFDDFQALLLQKSRDRSFDQKRKIDLLTVTYQMEDYVSNEDHDNRIAGDFLKLILKTLQIKQNRFARYLGMKPSNLSKLISGERPINYDLALVFGRLFSHSPMLWIKIQAKNELNKLVNAESEKYTNYSLSDLLKEPEEDYKKRS